MIHGSSCRIAAALALAAVLGTGGFGTRALLGVVVSLGEATEVSVTLQLATVTETMEVTAEASAVFSPSRSGTTAGIESGVIETLPTLERSLQDFARTNPFFVKTNSNANAESFLSVAGRSGRYNNIQIDGAVNNDLFGLAAQGTPGGQANTEPISLDAVSELQLVVAPYDVRQSGFSGGGVNVITRGGSNRFSGTAYLHSRNQGLVGHGADDVPIATFLDRQQGASVGGPLVRNRAFFFANVDVQRRETPVGYSLDGSSGIDFGRLAEAQRIADAARTRYGYDIPGGFGEIIRGNPNDKVFVRSDLNLSAAHRLSVRHNLVNATADVGSQSNFRYRFTDNFYLFRSRVATKVDKRFGDSWFMSGSYLYGESRSVNDGGSSQATSNWRYNYQDGDPNAVPLAMSNFSPGHRFSLSGSYRIPAGPAGITFSAYYDAQQGRPYSYLDGSDSNRDGTRGNDLLYVPRNAADVIVTDGTFDDLMRFLSAGCDVTPGTIVPRNACRGPWVYSLDFRLGIDFPRGPNEVEVFLDVRNLVNAFDARNGLVEFAFFQNLQPVRSSVDPDSGRYVYSLNTPARPGFTGDRFARDDLRSRWQAQLGVRYSFGR